MTIEYNAGLRVGYIINCTLDEFLSPYAVYHPEEYHFVRRCNPKTGKLVTRKVIDKPGRNVYVIDGETYDPHSPTAVGSWQETIQAVLTLNKIEANIFQCQWLNQSDTNIPLILCAKVDNIRGTGFNCSNFTVDMGCKIDNNLLKRIDDLGGQLLRYFKNLVKIPSNNGPVGKKSSKKFREPSTYMTKGIFIQASVS